MLLNNELVNSESKEINQKHLETNKNKNLWEPGLCGSVD